MNIKKLILVLPLFASMNAFANPQFSDIAKNADGTINYMTQADAIKYCASQGQHLPSARELAQLSTSMGSTGITDAYTDGYDGVSAEEVGSKKIDTFYFNATGYNRPTGDLGSNWFWSSSILSFNTDGAYVLRGEYGYIAPGGFRTSSNAVRCVLDK